MGLEHKGVDSALLVGERAEGDGTGDVGGAVEILSAAVYEQQPFGAQGGIGGRCGLVVHYGTVVGVCRNGVERRPAVQLLPGAQGLKAGRGAHLGLAAGLDSRAQPAQEANHGHAVAKHGTAEALDLGAGLHGLHGCHGRRQPNHLDPAHGVEQRVASGGGVHE